MRRPTSHSAWRIPKLPLQRTKHQFSLKALLILSLIAGPILAFLAKPVTASISFYNFTLLLFAAFPRNDFGFVLKFVIVGFIAFGIVPFCVAKLHPLFAWIACVVSAGVALILWHYATDKIVWHHPIDEASGTLSMNDARRVLEDPQARAMLDLELATAATAVFVGLVLGGLVSLFSRKFH